MGISKMKRNRADRRNGDTQHEEVRKKDSTTESRENMRTGQRAQSPTVFPLVFWYIV